MNILQVFRGVRFHLFAPISTHPKVDDGEVLAAMERERQRRIEAVATQPIDPQTFIETPLLKKLQRLRADAEMTKGQA